MSDDPPSNNQADDKTGQDPKKQQDVQELPSKKILEIFEKHLNADTPRDFAILLTGEWGSGKTWLVKKFIEKYKEDYNLCFWPVFGSIGWVIVLLWKYVHPVLSCLASVILIIAAMWIISFWWDDNKLVKLSWEVLHKLNPTVWWDDNKLVKLSWEVLHKLNPTVWWDDNKPVKLSWEALPWSSGWLYLVAWPFYPSFEKSSWFDKLGIAAFIIFLFYLICFLLQKTERGRKIFGKIGEKRPDAVLVSLYGVKTAEELGGALWAALHPAAPEDKWAIMIGRTLARNLKIDIKELENGLPHEAYPKNRILVFDDMERCQMPWVELFGTLHQLIEDHGNRLFLVSNEDEILRKFRENNAENSAEERDYYDAKEKTVGRTVKIKNNPKEAYQAFVERIKEGSYRKFLDDAQVWPEIERAISNFYGDKAPNLRNLNRALMAFEEIYQAVEEKYKNQKQEYWEKVGSTFNESSKKLLIWTYGYFVAYREDSKRAKIIDDIIRIETQDKEKEVGDEYGACLESFPKIKNDFFPNADDRFIIILHSFDQEGIPDSKRLSNYLEYSRLFRSPEDIPALQKMQTWFDLSPEKFKETFKKYRTDFEGKNYRTVGELAEFYMIYKEIEKDGLGKLAPPPEKEAFYDYIDDLFKENHDSYGNIQDIIDQLGWPDLDGDRKPAEVIKFVKDLKKRADEASDRFGEASFKKAFEQKKEEIKKKPRIFVELLREQQYHGYSVLQTLDGEKFATMLLKMVFDHRKERAIFQTIKQRHTAPDGHGNSAREPLRREAEWLVKTCKIYEGKLDEAGKKGLGEDGIEPPALLKTCKRWPEQLREILAKRYKIKNDAE